MQTAYTVQILNVTMEALVIEALEEFGYTEPTEDCYVQSFELSSLRRRRQLVIASVVNSSFTIIMIYFFVLLYFVG